MTEVFFSFDTEDYVNLKGADGVLRSAKLLRSAGIKGCFCVVARMAETFQKWGRTDVIEELRHHEISHHSLAHSYHPTINEYTDMADYDAAMEEFLRQEERAAEILKDIFDVETLPAACPPGNSVSYVAHYGYAKMGIPIYTGDLLVDPVRGRPIVNCNITSLPYSTCLDGFLVENTKEQIDAYLEEIARTNDVHIFYHHPHMSMFEEFWDMVNFNGENTPEEKWQYCRRHSAEHTELFYENFAYLVEKIKADPRFRITTYGEFAKNHCGQTRTLYPEQIPELKRQLQERFFPVTTPDSYCVSDIFLACRDFLLGETTHKCGDVYGFLDSPAGEGSTCRVTAAQMRQSAAAIGDGFLPSMIRVGEQDINPAQWLFAAMEVIGGAEDVELVPMQWQIDMTQFAEIRDMDLAGTWIHSESFRDDYLSRRYLLQSWTFRLPKDTQRFIFA